MLATLVKEARTARGFSYDDREVATEVSGSARLNLAQRIILSLGV